MKYPISKIAILTASFGLATAAYAASTGQNNGQAGSHGGANGTMAAQTNSHGGSSGSPAVKSGSRGGAATSRPYSPVKKAKAGNWGYEGNAGPDNWGELSSDYLLCKDGQAQSPINIEATEGQAIAPIEFDYHLTPLRVLHNGHTVQLNYEPGSGITVNGKRYELLQFHFHTPSEHAMNGDRAVMEVHFVHKSADGQLAVVGVMMKSGDENLALREIWHKMPRTQSKEQVIADIMINARDLLPKNKSYFRYMGSLTTPPCSEGVNWFVMDEPITVSAPQAQQFAKAVHGNNARPVQAVNNRLLLAPSQVN